MPSCRERCVAGGPAVWGGRHCAAPAEAEPALQLEHPGGGGGGGRGGSGPTGRQCHGLRCRNMQVNISPQIRKFLGSFRYRNKFGLIPLSQIRKFLIRSANHKKDWARKSAVSHLWNPANLTNYI
jgi:hypothetical protein